MKPTSMHGHVSLGRISRRGLVFASWLLLATAASAQLVDHQAGPNFPTAVSAFGTGRTENADLGDIDRDGDFDVFVDMCFSFWTLEPITSAHPRVRTTTMSLVWWP